MTYKEYIETNIIEDIHIKNIQEVLNYTKLNITTKEISEWLYSLNDINEDFDVKTEFMNYVEYIISNKIDFNINTSYNDRELIQDRIKMLIDYNNLDFDSSYEMIKFYEDRISIDDLAEQNSGAVEILKEWLTNLFQTIIIDKDEMQIFSVLQNYPDHEDNFDYNNNKSLILLCIDFAKLFLIDSDIIEIIWNIIF